MGCSNSTGRKGPASDKALVDVPMLMADPVFPGGNGSHPVLPMDVVEPHHEYPRVYENLPVIDPQHEHPRVNGGGVHNVIDELPVNDTVPWTCSVCTFQNTPDAANCRMCGVKPVADAAVDENVRIEGLVRSQEQISQDAYRQAQEEDRARPPPPPKPLLQLVGRDEANENDLSVKIALPPSDNSPPRGRVSGIKLLTEAQLSQAGRLSPPRAIPPGGGIIRSSLKVQVNNDAILDSKSSIQKTFNCVVCAEQCDWLRIADCTQPVCNSCVASDVLAQADRGTGRFWCPLRCHVIPYNILRSLNTQGVLSDELWSRLSQMHATAAIDDITATSGQKMLQCENCDETIIVSADTIRNELALSVVSCHSIHCQGASQICIRHGLTLRYAPGLATPLPLLPATVPQRPLSISAKISSPRQKTCVLCVQEQQQAVSPISGETTNQLSPVAAAMALSEQELTMNTRPCPKCGRRTYRDGGCRHMTCLCGHEYFWCCLRAYRDPEQAREHRRDNECEKYI